MKKLLVLALVVPLFAAGCWDTANNTVNQSGQQNTTSTNPPVTTTPNTTTPPTSSTGTNPGNSTSTPPASQINFIELGENETNKLITISEIGLEKPGFIAIHQDTNNSPGKALFSSKVLPAGKTNDIKLSAELTVGRSYWAMLHTDDGDGKFQELNDSAAKYSDGTPVQVKFTTEEADAS